jgi:uncharacterized protein YodC (DUF2158 family)
LTAPHFLIGDQVRHVSGGVTMTVTHIDGDWITVMWFERRQRTAVFKATTLRLAKADA